MEEEGEKNQNSKERHSKKDMEKRNVFTFFMRLKCNLWSTQKNEVKCNLWSTLRFVIILINKFKGGEE